MSKTAHPTGRVLDPQALHKCAQHLAHAICDMDVACWHSASASKQLRNRCNSVRSHLVQTFKLTGYEFAQNDSAKIRKRRVTNELN